MANITAMPFRSVDGDRPVSATMDARRFAQYVTNGIDSASSADALKVSPSSDGLSIVVAPGGAVINGYSGWLDAEETLTPITPNASNPRIDRVVFRLNLNLDVRYFQLLLLPGTPASSPTPPAITRDEMVYDLVLADVLISAGSVVISDSSITDHRADADLCGYLNAKLAFAGGYIKEPMIDPNVIALITAAQSTANAAQSTANAAQSTANAAPKIAVGSYTGTGTYGASKKNTLTFGFRPKFVLWFVIDKKDPTESAVAGVWNQNITKSYVSSSQFRYYTINDTGLTWYANLSGTGADTKGPQAQLNTSGAVYYYIAIG